MSKLTATFKSNGSRSFIFTVDGDPDQLAEFESYQDSKVTKNGKTALVYDQELNLPLFFIPNFEIWENESGATQEVKINVKEYAGLTFNLVWLDETDEYEGRYVLENSIESQAIRAQQQQAAALSAGFKRRKAVSKAEANLQEPTAKPTAETAAAQTSARPRGRSATRR